jgi:energy-coupling factor transporter transmembrane protein EcfT
MLSPWGYLLFTLWALASLTFVDGWRVIVLAVLVLAFGLAWSRKGLNVLRRGRFWLFVLTAVALGPFLSRKFSLGLEPLQISRMGLMAGGEMAARAFVITVAFSVGLSPLSVSDLVAIFDRLGLRGLGFATGLAMNLMGTLREMATVTLQTIRLRGGLRRPWVSLRLFLVTLVSNTLRYGDQLVDAAMVRAFDPARGRPAALPLRPADRWLVATLVASTVGLLALGR